VRACPREALDSFSFAKHHKAQAPASTNAITVTTSLVSTTDFPSQTVRPPAGPRPATIIDVQCGAKIVTKKNPKPEYARLGLLAGYYFNIRSSKLSGRGAGGL
jgi:hypothetical protein